MNMSSSEMAPIMVLNWSRNEKDLVVWKFGQFVVRVLNEDERNEALNLVWRALFTTRADPIINALMFDLESRRSLKSCLKVHLEQNIAYGCFRKAVVEQGKKKKLDKLELVAVDVLYVRNLNDKFTPSKDLGLAFGNWITYINRIEKHVWSMGEQKIHNILSSFGIFISDESRNDTKIAIEMMKNRKELAKNLQIKILGAAFIGEEIQKTVENYKYYKNTYKKLHFFNKNDCKELGLGDVCNEEYIKLLTVFPIIVMGFKKNIKRREPSVAEIREKTLALNKKSKIEE